MDGKIGLFVNSVEGYQGCIVHEAQEAAHGLGIELAVFDAQHSAVRQAQEVVRFHYDNPGQRLCVFVIPEADAIQQGPVEDDPTFHLAIRLVQKGVGWIMLNHGREEFVASLKSRFPEPPIALVAVDNVDFGRVQGQQLRGVLPGGGKALSVRGNPFDTACHERSEGMKGELQGSRISIEEIDARWSDEEAEAGVAKWLASPLRRQATLDVVSCQNDHMGAGARHALDKAAEQLGRPDLKRVPVLGGDGLPDFGLRWVDEGLLLATVRVTLPGRPAVEQLARHWTDGSALPAVTRLPVSSYPPLTRLAPLPPQAASPTSEDARTKR